MSSQLPIDFVPQVAPPPTRFRGAAYVPHLDGDRLQSKLDRIIRFMTSPSGVFYTLEEICEALEARHPGERFAAAPTSAQLRNARKEPYRYRVDRRRRGAADLGLFEYAMYPPEGEPHA